MLREAEDASWNPTCSLSFLRLLKGVWKRPDRCRRDAAASSAQSRHLPENPAGSLRLLPSDAVGTPTALFLLPTALLLLTAKVSGLILVPVHPAAESRLHTGFQLDG